MQKFLSMFVFSPIIFVLALPLYLLDYLYMKYNMDIIGIKDIEELIERDLFIRLMGSYMSPVELNEVKERMKSRLANGR